MRARISFLVAGTLVLAMVACRPLRTATPEPAALDTAVAQTVRAILTSEAPTGTPSSRASETPTPEPSVTLRPTYTPSLTSEPATHTATMVPTIGPATNTPATPSPTSIPTTLPAPTNTPTASPTAIATPTCILDVAPQFSSRLEAHPEIMLALGCPVEPARETWTAEQRFQLGGMFWQEDTDVIHMLYSDGTYQFVPDQWEEGDPEYTCPEDGPPPAGLFMPQRGFGWHWCNTPGVQGRLGWALEEEKGYQAVWQNFEHGHVLHNRQDVLFVLYDDVTWDTIG